MSFTPPTTYASNATTGYLAQFLIGTSLTSPLGLVAVSEVKSIRPGKLVDVPQVPTSHLLSVANTEEFIPGMIKPGTVTISGQLIGDATHLQFLTLAKAQTLIPFAFVSSIQRGAKTYTCPGVGYIASYEPGPFELNKPIEFTAEIQITGAVTETVA